MNLFVEALRREVAELHRNNVRLKFVGALDELKFRFARQNREGRGQDSQQQRPACLTVAIAYGGRWDIVQATRSYWHSGLPMAGWTLPRK